MRRIAISVVATLLALSAVAPAVAAQDEPVPVFPCIDGLTFQVEAGQDIVVYCAWSVNAKGLVQAYRTSAERTLVLRDGVGAVVWSRGPAETEGYYMPPVWSRASDFPGWVCHPDVGWLLPWQVALGTLPAGTYTLTQTETFTHPVTDGFHQCWYEGVRLAEPPSMYRGTYDTTVTIVVE